MSSSFDDNLYWKLQASVECLATGNGNLTKKLENIFISFLLPLNCNPQNSEIEMFIWEAQTLASQKKYGSETLGDLYITLHSNHWTKNKKIAKYIFKAYTLACAEYFRIRS